MSSRRYDLHAHSAASDGMLSPRELVALAVDRGLSGIALTDHDTVAGIDEATAMADALGVDVIPGIELSCSSEWAGEAHLLAYFIRPADSRLAELLGELRGERLRRAMAIVERINDLGVSMTIDDVLNVAAGAPPGRPHVARALVTIGAIEHESHAFSREWIAPGGRAWVRRDVLPIARAIAAIHDAGGVAVFAHPGRRAHDGIREAAVRDAAAHGLDGIEVDHPDHTDDAVRLCARLGGELNLIQTAGSDDHQRGVDGSQLGCRTVPELVVEQLRMCAATYQ